MPRTIDHNAVFRTYYHYLRAINLYLDSEYGRDTDLFIGLSLAFNQCRGTANIRRRVNNQPKVTVSMRQAWATEVFIHHQADTAANAEVISCANLWATVQSYYATFHAAQAVLIASHWWSATPDTHAGTLKLLSELVSRRQHFPPPFDAGCHGTMNDLSYTGSVLGVNIAYGNSLAPPTEFDCRDRLGMLLRTTRERQIDEAKAKWLISTTVRKPDGSKYVRVPVAHQSQIAERLATTTLFDFLYRFRIRSNYHDAEAFLLGAAGQGDGIGFSTALVTFLQATLFSLELLLSRIIGADALRALAEDFIDSVGEPGRQTVGERLPFY